MSLVVRNHHLSFSAPEIEERGYISPDELDYIPSDLNIKLVRLLQSHSLQTTSLPENLSCLKFIHIVDLSGTQIKGEDLVHLPPRIRELKVEDCEEIDFLPPSLKRLELLTTLNVSKTYIREQALDNLPQSLEILKIESCKLIKQLPESFACMHNLQSVYMANSGIRYLDHIPRTIENIYAKFCPIETLSFSFNDLQHIREIHLSYKYFNVDSLRSIASYIDRRFVTLRTIVIDRESAQAYYFRFTLRNDFSEERCIKLIKKHAPKLKSVSIVIEN